MDMDLTALSALSPIDGRYRRHTKGLAEYLSEFGLIKYRVRVEIEYFIALCERKMGLEPLFSAKNAIVGLLWKEEKVRKTTHPRAGSRSIKV